ncbi:DUF1703-domain-containing protein [Serendipita vermifera]|nr:DUF1703-domain-containing protein [Serendipita vermifera]
MSAPQSDIYSLDCILDDEQKVPFIVHMAASAYVDELKKAIADEFLKDIKRTELTLHRVDIQEPVKTRKAVVEKRISSLCENDALDPVAKLSGIYTSVPPEGAIHIIAQVSSSRKRSHDMTVQSATVSPSNSQRDTAAQRPLKRRRLRLLPESKTIYKADSHSGEGKTTLLETLINYYDKSQKDRFEENFRHLYIGQNPTSASSSLLILRFNFSAVISGTSYDPMEKSFNDMMNIQLRRFLHCYQEFLGGDHSMLLDGSNGTISLENVIDLVLSKKERLFVGVDDYDAPANLLIFKDSAEAYIVVRNFLGARFFSTLQRANQIITKCWITGVLPVFLEDVSPLNATRIASDMPAYSGICGFTDMDVRQIAQSYLSVKDDHELETAIKEMKRWDNGYRFKGSKRGPKEHIESLYNPFLVFSHLRGFVDNALAISPQEKIGAPHISSALAAISDKDDASFLDSWLQLVSNRINLKTPHLLGANEIQHHSKSPTTTWSLLYYFGVLTYDEEYCYLRISNLTMLNTVTQRFRQLLDRPMSEGFPNVAVHACLMDKDVAPLTRFLEATFKKEYIIAVKNLEEKSLWMTISALWLNSGLTCLTELSLVVEPSLAHGQGYSGFLGLFFSGVSAPCIELKSITLENLWRGERGALPQSETPLNEFRAKLNSETEEELLKRKIVYNTVIQSVEEVKQEAFKQITRYLEVMQNGKVQVGQPGVHDTRIEQIKSVGELVGYVVMLLGGTRVLAWHVLDKVTEFTLVARPTYNYWL